jgi:hypothetical protein
MTIADNISRESKPNSCQPNLIDTDFGRLERSFDDVILKIAKRYNLFDLEGKPRKAAIIEVVSKTICISCIDRQLKSNKYDRIDDFYKECHKFACNLLAEELYDQFSKLGYAVFISSEKNVEYGKVDILIVPNRRGFDLCFNKKEVGIEVKTGVSLSFSQLFRYMLDNVDRTIILWRIRNRQVLLFEGTKLKPLLTQFMMMIVSRAERLLSNPEMSCKQALEPKNWSPNQQQLQDAFSDFSEGVVKTLPRIVEAVVMMLDGEQIGDVTNKFKISKS